MGSSEKKNLEQRVVVVLGTHRSGTSAVMRGLNVLGVELGDRLLGAGPDNPRGFWEDEDIVALNERLLSTLGMRWHSVRHIDPEILALPAFDHLKAQATDLLRKRYAEFPLWGFKDPRTARLLPFWQAVFKETGLEPVYVIIIRNPVNVARSLFARNGISEEKSHLIWMGHMLAAVKGTEGTQRIILDYDRLMDTPVAELHRLAYALDISMDEEAKQSSTGFAKEFLDRDLRHAAFRGEDMGSHAGISNLAWRMYECLLRPARDETGWEDTEFRRTLSEIETEFENLSSMGNYIDALEDAIVISSDGERKALAGQIRLKDGEIDRLSNEIAVRGREIKRLDDEVIARGKEIKRLDDEVIARGKEIKRLDDEVIVRGGEIKRLDGELRSKAEEARGFKALYEDKSRQLFEVLGSTSWRISAPVRMVKSGVLGAGRIIRKGGGGSISLGFKLLRLILRSFYSALPLPAAFKEGLKTRLIRLVDHCVHDANVSRNRESLVLLAAGRQSILRMPLDEGRRKPEPYDESLLDISVVGFNGKKWIEGFVKSVIAQQYPLNMIRLIVVDHGSTDGSLELWDEMLKKYSSEFRGLEIHKRKNKGFGAGHNYAFSISSAPFFLVTNMDLEFEPDAIDKVMAFARADVPEAASWELRQKPYEHPKYYDPVTLETAWSSNACILFRSKAFRAVGGYEKRIFMYGEDVELSFRLRDRGYLARYCPKAAVWHYCYEDTGQFRPLQFVGSTLANSYIRLRFGVPADILRIPGMYLSLFFKPPAAKAGYWAIIKNMVKVLIHSPYFLATRKKGDIMFPFRGWDYEMSRDGAFYNHRGDMPDRMPLVSIITRTYQGREAWLREALVSVGNQTYPNIELIVVEDGSDTASDMISAARKQYDMIIIHRPLPKKGRSYAGNEGLKTARGEYMMFLDDDDLLMADHVEVLISEIVADSHVVAAYALSWEVMTEDAPDSPAGYMEMGHITPSFLRQPFSRDVMEHHNYIPIQAIIFERRLYERYGGLDEVMEYLEDWNLWLRYSSQDDFLYVEKTTSLFRTPFDPEKRTRRQELLDANYKIAAKQ